MSSTNPCMAVGEAIPSRAMLSFGAVALGTILAGSSAPTPLYRLYQEEMGFPPLILTLIFAAYALALLVALLTAGSLSDHIGRRPVISAALLLAAGAMVLFATAETPAMLVAARVVQGLSAGMGAAALGAALLDADRARAPMVNSIAPFAGMAAGALGASLLAAYAPLPHQLVYLLLLAAFLTQAALIWWIPETAARRPGALASLRPHVEVPPQARRTLLAITPMNLAAWAAGGFYLSLMPSLLRAVTGVSSPLIGGAVVALMTLSAAAAVLVWRGLPPQRALAAGAGSLSFGVLALLLGAQTGSVPLLIAAAVLIGGGLGGGFFGASRSLLPLAAPQERAGLLAAFYVQSYLAFSLPALLAGLMVQTIGLVPTTHVFGGAVFLLSAGSLAAMRVRSDPAQP
ncbi:MFS transporter [Roseococcus pinisoli]|uniref:MFS transporter n=1 Tax=Roseococcus pinisoli TaxID=2835040 RepID=A0ABS5QFZ1_9PROT|nr:MFS transporter [Roseococcus pinisoli]MBS7811458.1 MFS transporter [Roseococcus pinisoli]